MTTTNLNTIKERPIIFSGPMVKAILEGRKSQSRRVIEPQPQFLYRLTGDRIDVMLFGGKEASNEDKARLCKVQEDPGFSMRRLPGWERWEDLLSHEICGIWQEGARGMVSLVWNTRKPRILDGLFMSSKQKSDQTYTPAYLYGISRDATNATASNKASGRQQEKQQAGKSGMGNTSRELGGSKGSRPGNRGRETSCLEIHERGTPTHTMGHQEGSMQSKARSSSPTDGSIIHWRNCPWQVGMKLWVRETWEPAFRRTKISSGCVYKADYGYRIDLDKTYADFATWKPSIHMPRWASRITLEIMGVKVERVQKISKEDAKAEGIRPNEVTHQTTTGRVLKSSYLYMRPFRELWDSINAKRGYGWDANPYVWVLTFKGGDLDAARIQVCE